MSKDTTNRRKNWRITLDYNKYNVNPENTLDLSNTAIEEYLYVVKSEYDIERNKKQSFENRAGLILALLGAVCILLFEKVNLQDIFELFNNILCFTLLIKILSGILVYIAFGFTFIAILKTIIASKHNNFEVKSINESLIIEERKTAIARLIFTYRDIIITHRVMNERRSKWYIASLYSIFITFISIVLYLSL